MMYPTLKAAVTDKEVLLDVTDHPFVFACGACPVWPTCPRGETVLQRQIHKAFIEFRLANV